MWDVRWNIGTNRLGWNFRVILTTHGFLLSYIMKMKKMKNKQAKR
jgi:hypothetical protein